MRWTELLAALEARPLTASGDFAVDNIAAADLLSDVLATEKSNFVILTGQATPQAVRTALAVGALGMVIVRAKRPLPETIALASEYELPLATSDAMMFEACCAAGALLWNSRSPTS